MTHVPTMPNSDRPCVGYVQLVFFDDASGEVVTIGGDGFVAKDEDDSAWADIPVFHVQSSFMSDRLDADEDIIDDKAVSAETCKRLTGRPIAQLIAEGRARLAAQLSVLAAA